METSQARKDDKVFGIIDNVLQHVLGEDATQLIYNHLEHRYSLRRCEISDNLGVFTKGLEDFLDGAALPINNKILNDILSAANLDSGIRFHLAVPEEIQPDNQIIATPNI